MAYTRNGRGQRSTTQRQPNQPAAPASTPDPYTLIVGGLVSCRRCAALLPDTRPARDQHDQFHQALRALYERLGARP
jgi:hypothetical protein